MVDGEASDLTLDEVLASAADDLDGVSPSADATGTTWSIEGVVFAAIARETAEFRLDAAVIGAALRTPDTRPSPRGPDWIAFAPLVLDDHAVDRAEAWFLSAARRAARGGATRNR